MDIVSFIGIISVVSLSISGIYWKLSAVRVAALPEHLISKQIVHQKLTSTGYGIIPLVPNTSDKKDIYHFVLGQCSLEQYELIHRSGLEL